MPIFNIANQAALDAARVGFHAAFLEQLGLVNANALDPLFTDVESSTGIEEWDWLGDLPGMEEWKGDRMLSDLQAFSLRVTNKDWSSGIRVHQNNIKDDKLGLMAPKIQELARKARTHKIGLAMQQLVDGFAGGVTGNGLAYDGLFFFSSARATGSNRMTAALSSAELINAEVLLASQTTYDGKEPLEMAGTHLIVGPKLRPVAEKLLLSDYLPNAGGTATETNYLKGRYQLIVSPYLRGTYDDYWFLADLSKPIKPMMFQLREDISTSAITGDQGGSNDSIPRFQRGELWFGVEARYNVAYLEPRTIVGSIVA